MNSKICYLYRDVDNYKVHNECVINGLLNDNQKAKIFDSLHDGEWFIPSKVGLPEKRFDKWDDEADHIWFELDGDGFEETEAPANVAITPVQLVEAFERNRNCWESELRTPSLDNSIEMRKQTIAKEIGNYFGSFFEADGKYCIDNYEQVFRYDSLNALLTDWVDTLVENHHDNANNPPFSNINDSWEDEIVFIYSEVIGKFPPGVRQSYNKYEEARWQSSVDVYLPGQTGTHGKNLHLGTYASIVDAMFARREFEAFRDENKDASLDELAELADALRRDAKIKDLSWVVQITLDQEEIKQLQAATGCKINSNDDLRTAVLTAIEKYVETYMPVQKHSLDDKIKDASAKVNSSNEAPGNPFVKRDLTH